MTEIQTWFRNEMERNGFGPMTFPLERDADGTLVIHVVTGTRAYAQGEEVTADEMWDQVQGPLLERGIDIKQEYVILLANTVFITDQDGVKLKDSRSHYVGRGRYRYGMAFATDCELVDPLNLPKKEPMVLCGGTYSYTAGEYAIVSLGGIAHEFGHALGLPHNMQTDEQLAELGWSLMGRGNYHFLGKRAGKEQGAHLTKAHATILSQHPVFRRDTTPAEAEAYRTPGECRFLEVEFTSGEGEYIITGRVESSRRAYAVVAYHDLMHHHSDYDSTSWVSEVDEDGRFEVHVGALTPGPYELRVRCFLIDSSMHQLTYHFDLDESLTVPAEKLKRQTLYEFYAKPAIEARDPDAMLIAIDKLKDVDDVHSRRAKAYYGVMTRTPSVPRDLSAISDAVGQVQLSQVKWESADVGWDEPTRHAVPVRDEDDNRKDMPLESGARFYETGLYAHAPSSYVFDLDGTWKRFTSAYGLENLCQGSVVFVVNCDSEERFRSDLVEDWTEGHVDIDVTGVKQLELVVTDGGNGKQGDCAIWFSPMLSR